MIARKDVEHTGWGHCRFLAGTWKYLDNRACQRQKWEGVDVCIIAFVSRSLTGQVAFRRKELRTTPNEEKYENLGAMLRQSREVRGEDR